MKLHRIKALLLNYYYISFSSADRLFDILYWPILDVLIWGFMTFFISGISEFNIINSIMGGIVLWLFVWRGSQDLVVYLLEFYWSRSVYHLFVSPVKQSELVVSLCLFGMIRSFISFVLVSVLGYFLYSFNIFNFSYQIFFFIGVLFIIAWAIGLFISSLLLRFGTRIQVLAWSVIWIIQPFSCVFYPLSALPPWAASIASINPLTTIFEGMRVLVQGGTVELSVLWYPLLVGIGLLVGMAFVFMNAMKSAKRQGRFAKPE